MQANTPIRREDDRSAEASASKTESPPRDLNPKAGFSDAALRAARRVIENEVQRVNARYAPKAP